MSQVGSWKRKLGLTRDLNLKKNVQEENANVACDNERPLETGFHEARFGKSFKYNQCHIRERYQTDKEKNANYSLSVTGSMVCICIVILDIKHY